MHADAFPHAQGRWAAGCGESLYLSDAGMEEKLYQFAQFAQLCLLAGSLTAYQAFAITNSVSAPGALQANQQRPGGGGAALRP